MSDYVLCTKEGKYFCYIDGRHFSSKLAILNHYVISHRDDKEQLKAWGLSYDCMKKQALFLTGELDEKHLKRVNKDQRYNQAIRKEAIKLYREKCEKKRQNKKLMKEQEGNPKK